MYVPKLHKEEDLAAVKDFIGANGFAILVSQADGRPWATHIPLLLDKNTGDKDVLTGHLSKANKQWKDFENNSEVLAIFSGPHAYISSSWYDHENVPTWNYLAVHVYGTIKLLNDADLKKQLTKLVDKYEAGLPHPVSVDSMTAGYVEREMRGVVGFEITITEIQAVSKLSQNRDAKNHEAIIEGLMRKGDAASIEMAETMKRARQG